MQKKVMLVMGLMLLLSSCGELRYGIEKTVFEMEQDKEEKEATKKDGPGAVSRDKYRGGVEEIVKDISKRPLNKRVQFEGVALIIPEGTVINSKQGNIIDMKTGYGIPITFSGSSSGCIAKKVKENIDYGIFYNKTIPEISKIAQKIISINGFKNTCSK